MAEEQQSSLRSKVELGYFRLTHELLKNVKINQITFAFFRLIQTIQIIHFVFRDSLDGQWNNIIFKYSQLVVNYISVDYLIDQNPNIYISLNLGLCILMAVTICCMVLFGWKLTQDKKPASALKTLFPLVDFSLYLFKTILQIPVMTIILVSFITSFQISLGVTNVNGIQVLIGVLNLLFFSVIQIYLITSFKDSNPFSDLIHAGQNITKSVTFIVYKLLLSLYLALDYNGSLGINFLVVFLVISIGWTLYKHAEIGFFKNKIRNICLKLNYVVLVFSFLSLMKAVRPTDQFSVLLFLAMVYIMCYVVCDYVENKLCLRAIQKQMMFIKSSSDLQEHIIHLVRNIDTFEKRQSRILLQGYLAYHHRQCKLPETSCICHHLKEVKQRSSEQKSQFFQFMIDILKQNLNRFTDPQKIHLHLAFIYQYRLKNRFQAIYSITRTLKQNSFLNRLYHYHQINLIESQMIEDDSKDQTNKAVDINKFFQYNNMIVSFEEMLQECTRSHVQFWKELLQVNTDIKKLEKSGTLVTNSKDIARDQFQKMLNLNPNNVHTLTVYGRFLIDVANEEASNIKYLQKAQSILKNLKESSKIDDNSNKYTDNAETTVVVIDGNQGKLGEIVHTNNYVKKMLGYKRSQCIGENVQIIMPKVFGEFHTTILQRYLSTSSDKYNGKERVVPALAKDGYMIPVVGLTKALANLQYGIQIVGFISKLQERPEEQQIVRRYFYMLYRTDNEQIMGISQNCFTDFHIPCCLVYGNPYNNNNQLKIRNLFGFSFQKDKQGQVSAALETSEVVLTMNSTKLSEQFIITRSGTNQEIKDQLLHLDSSDFGVQVKIVARCLLTINYNGIPLKMLSIYKFGEDKFQSKNDERGGEKGKAQESSRYFNKTQNDDFKDLKDFKNFISIKSQPSAISIINNICLILIFVITACIISYIVIWSSMQTQNIYILDVTRKGVKSDTINLELIFQLQKYYINRNPKMVYKSFNQTTVKNFIKTVLSLVKTNQRQFLPLKFYFINNYNLTMNQYSFDTTGNLLTKVYFIGEYLTMFFSIVQSLLDSQLDTLYSNPLSYDSNPFLMYLTMKYTALFSLMQANTQTTEDVISAYNSQVALYQVVFYILTSIMLFSVALWFFTSIPYVLSVSKINNRVLSLFSLIPNRDVFKLISRCHIYMKENLTQAIVSSEDTEQILEDSPIDNQNESYMGASSLGLGISSPAPFLQNKGQSMDGSPSTLKKNTNLLSQSGSPMSIQQKFNKMVNSENQQKNKTIFQFLVISLLLIGYFLFNHFYAFSNVNSIQTQITNLKYLGRRVSLLTGVKFLLTEYLMNPQLQVLPSLPNIRQLNDNIIQTSYNIQSTLLSLDIGPMDSTLSKYDSGNLCNYITEYNTSAWYATTLSYTECIGLKQGILAKGIKTAIVTILQQVRTIITTPTIVNQTQLLYNKMIEYDTTIKYLQNPMLYVIGGTQNYVGNTIWNYDLVLIVTSMVFLVTVLLFWRIVWTIYIEELNNKIWRTKGMLNIIPMRIITANELLKNEFASGQLQKAVR